MQIWVLKITFSLALPSSFPSSLSPSEASIHTDLFLTEDTDRIFLPCKPLYPKEKNPELKFNLHKLAFILYMDSIITAHIQLWPPKLHFLTKSG